MFEKFYSTRETAEILGVTTRAVEKWRLEGKLRPVKAGKLCRYPESEIRRFLGLSADGDAAWVAGAILPPSDKIHAPMTAQTCIAR